MSNKCGPMRGPLVHHPVHCRLHGLTRHGMESAGIFKGFSSENFTFTYPLRSFINTHSYRYKASEKEEAGDDTMRWKKPENEHLAKKDDNEMRHKMKRKLNIGMRSYGIIDKHILVRGAFLLHGEFGKPPIPKNHILGGV